ARIRCIFLDGYGVLVVRIVIFKISSFKLQNARLLLIFTKYSTLFDVINDPHDDAHPEGENSAKRQKIFEHGTFEIRGSSSGQDYEGEPGPSTSGNQEQFDEFDYWTNSYPIDDDVIPNEKVSQELVDEISQTVDEAKLRKAVDEMKEIIVPSYQPKPTPVVQSCQRDPKAPGLPLVNQDLLYLKKGNSGPDKIVLSLHKFPAVIFPDDDIEERTSRWVKKRVKRFNPYARYGVEHWKNPHAKIFYIKNQQALRKPNEEIYSNSKISDYKNLNKNDIEDMYLLIINHKVDDYAETGLLWSLAVFIRSTMIWERVHDFQLGMESYQQQENNKKEKRVMRHQEVYKFCDATLKRVLEGLKSYNNNVKYGYVTHNLSKEDVEYLQLFAEEIEEWLKYRDQMRRWKIYVNGRPLGSRRERLE
ncbi:hypothetical protein Tco_1259292, partial [Tanacetum coccineum]